MLSLTRGTATYHGALRSDPAAGWKFADAPLVRRLRGAVIGIIGLGRIGLAAGLRAQAFGMRVHFYDPYLPNGADLSVNFTRMRKLEDLMAISDVVSVHAPLSDETRNIMGAKAFACAKPGLILINTARGPMVDLDALATAIRDGKIGGAGLDVTPVEPADANHPLISAWMRGEPWLEGRLTLSPHAAFYSPASIEDMRRKSIETVLDYLREGRLANCVNREFLEPKR
jgi:D-3-phosphoglycerate dehydrogenase/C-terminal binding protein